MASYPLVHPYDGELLQSAVGRACSYFGNDYASFNGLFFEKSSIYYRSALHWRMAKEFSRRFPCYTVQKILDNHCLLPFFSWFNQPAARLASQLVVGENVRNYGFSRHPLNSWKFKFCPECAREQHQKYGEFFWLREHQIYGVNICLEHDCPLMETTLPLSGKGLSKEIGFINASHMTETYELSLDRHSKLIALTARELAKERTSKPVNTKEWMRYLCKKYGRPTDSQNEQMSILESVDIKRRIREFWGSSYCEKLGWEHPLGNLRGHEWWGWLKLLKAIDPEASLLNCLKEAREFNN